MTPPPSTEGDVLEDSHEDTAEAGPMPRLEHLRQHPMVSSHALLTILYEIDTTTPYDAPLSGLSRFCADNLSLSLSKDMPEITSRTELLPAD